MLWIIIQRDTNLIFRLFFCTSAKTRYHKLLKSQKVHFTVKSGRKTEMVNYQLYFTTTWRNVQ